MSFLQDLRHAWRLFVTRPHFAVAAVVTLAVALGANTAVFGVVDAVLLRPLPYSEPSRLSRCPSSSRRSKGGRREMPSSTERR